jgi:cell division protein FtsB
MISTKPFECADGEFCCPVGEDHRGAKGTKSNVTRHMRKCKLYKAAVAQVDETNLREANMQLQIQLKATQDLLTTATAQVQTLSTHNDQLSARNAQLESEVKALKKRKVTTNNNTFNFVNINIVPVFDADGRLVEYDKLDNPPQESVVRRLLKVPESAVPKYIELKYFSGDEPPIVCKNVRDNKVHVVQNDLNGKRKWVCKDKKATIDALVENGVDELESYYDADSVSKWKEWADKELPTVSETLPAYKKMVKDVEAVILNHRSANNVTKNNDE